MAVELKKEDGWEEGYSMEETTTAMQSILYMDCNMVRQQKQLLEDEEYAKELQERLYAELDHRTMSLSVTETDDEYAGEAHIYEPVPGHIRSPSGNWFSIDDEPPPHDEYEALHAFAERLGPAQPPGLRKSDIDMLPTRRFEPKDDPKGSSATATCHICLNKWKHGDSIKSLPCFHDFHKKCITEWLKLKKACPICRLEVKFSSH